MSKDDRRAHLLASAVELLDAEGPGAMTMERVAERAGVSKPVVYDHFPNRSALVLALAAETWAEVDMEIARRASESRTPAERIRATFDAFLDTSARQGPHVRGLIHSASADPEVEQARRTRWKAKESAWAGGLERELGLAPPTAAAAAAVLRAAMVGAVAHARTSAAARVAATEVYVTTVLATLGTLSGRTEGSHP